MGCHISCRARPVFSWVSEWWVCAIAIWFSYVSSMSRASHQDSCEARHLTGETATVSCPFLKAPPYFESPNQYGCPDAAVNLCNTPERRYFSGLDCTFSWRAPEDHFIIVWFVYFHVEADGKGGDKVELWTLGHEDDTSVPISARPSFGFPAFWSIAFGNKADLEFRTDERLSCGGISGKFEDAPSPIVCDDADHPLLESAQNTGACNRRKRSTHGQRMQGNAAYSCLDVKKKWERLQRNPYKQGYRFMSTANARRQFFRRRRCSRSRKEWRWCQRTQNRYQSQTIRHLRSIHTLRRMHAYCMQAFRNVVFQRMKKVRYDLMREFRNWTVNIPTPQNERPMPTNASTPRPTRTPRTERPTFKPAYYQQQPHYNSRPAPHQRRLTPYGRPTPYQQQVELKSRYRSRSRRSSHEEIPEHCQCPARR